MSTNLWWGLFWIGVYLALVSTPVFLLILGPTPPSLGFWWDLSLALGFAGAAMMGVQFVLTARFRRATAPYGIDVIYYFHRYVGVVTGLIVLAHPVILFVNDPGLLFLLNPLAAPGHMVAGLASVTALALLIATSVWRKTFRLPYEGWRVGHAVLAVAAIFLALVHMDGVGYYLASPWKRGLWATIGASLIAVIVYVRLIRPIRLVMRPYRVVRVTEERGDAWTLSLEPEGHAGIRFQAGQFAWLTMGGSPLAMREHPFSIVSASTRLGQLQFTIKELGDFTRTIKHTREGERAYVDGPYGAFTLERHEAPGYVFIAGGIGIAPIMSMLRTLADRRDPRPLLLIYAYRRWERMTFREEIEGLKSQLDLNVVYVLEEPPEGWTGERGRVGAALFDRHLPASRKTLEHFICGPVPMIEAAEKALYELGVPLSRCHTELFDLV